MGLVATTAYSDCAGICVDLVHSRGRTTANLASTVEMGVFGKRSDLSGIVHRNLRLQLVLDRIQRSRYTLGLAEFTISTGNCGRPTNMV